jgi:hypothetical protein
MTALWALLLCAVVPPIVSEALRGVYGVSRGASEEQRTRALGQSQRASLIVGALVVPIAAVAGALCAPPVLATRWPAAGAWFFSSVCAMVAWASLALSRRGQDEAEAMPVLEVFGRVAQMVAVPSMAVGLSLLFTTAVDAFVPMIPSARAIIAGLLSVFGFVVVSPWLTMQLGLWRLLPVRIHSQRNVWRVAHLPVPHPFVAHTAALPWLSTVLVTDGLFTRGPDSHWRSLVYYEIGGATGPTGERTARWLVAVVLSVAIFVLASTAGADDPRKLVAGIVLAVVFTGASTWFANREHAASVVLEPDGPSMQELAQTLRSLPPPHGQALPPTSHRPVGVVLYDRLYALGHDPGRRRRA